MLYAISNNEKIEAKPNTRAKCLLCEREVFSKCGEVNVWHWTHLNEESCDGWHEPETIWHKEWKNLFGKTSSEVIISKDGVKHRADIYTKSEVVIELQNSPILKPVIRERELFYGERMLWVINGLHFKLNFDLNAKDIQYYRNFRRTNEGIIDWNTEELFNDNEYRFFVWKWCKKSWDEVRRPVFIDFGESNLFLVKEGMGTAKGFGKIISKENFLKKYL